MTETTRIRWHHVDGTVVEWFGYVGTVTETALFQILHPVAKPTEAIMGSRFDEWALCTTFPGESAKARYAGDRDGTKAVTELKAEAERWLEEFAASLGAIFPPEQAHWSQLREHVREERAAQDQLAADHEESGHDWQTERAYGAVLILDRLMAVMDQMEAGQ